MAGHDVGGDQDESLVGTAAAADSRPESPAGRRRPRTDVHFVMPLFVVRVEFLQPIALAFMLITDRLHRLDHRDDDVPQSFMDNLS